MGNDNYRFYILVIAIFIAVTSCREEFINIPIPEISCNDSTLLEITDTMSLNIGSELNPIPYVSQLYISDSTEIYIAKDEQLLYFYNLLTDTLIYKVNLDNCPPLKSFSGFYYMGDSTLVYSYLTNEIITLDDNFKIIQRTGINNSLIHLESLSGSPILFSGERVILSGTPNLNPYKYKDPYPVSISYSLKENNAILGGDRPMFYQTKNVGGTYMWRIFHTVDSNQNIVYSFPLFPYVEIYSNILVKNKEVYMGSRYNNQPVVMNSSLNDALSDYKEKMYYLRQDTYGPIIYDRFRDIYYRIATHPQKKYKEGEMTLKPFSIIAMNTKGVIVTETPIFYHNNTMFYDKLYVSSRGLLMQTKSDNENIMKFLVFNSSLKN